MSGIVGIFSLDGRNVGRDDIAPMLQSMPHRGPDGSRIWTGGQVGLGHAMLHTTPESLHENYPVESRCGQFVLTADARVDNRAELITKLDLSRGRDEVLTDADLLLDAYTRWGRDLGKYVIGDYAVAVWDSRERRLVCVRDHAGIKPFFYVHLPGRLFAFASDIRALLVVPGVPHRLNGERVADYLANIWLDPAYTFYDGIQRVPAAHSMVVDRDGLDERRYWELNPDFELDLSSSREYEEAFREHFTEAVRCRLRTAKSIGAMLSGGLDSTAVVGTARSIFQESGIGQLPVYSIIFDESTSCDERPYIRKMIDGGGLKWHTVQGDHPEHLPIRGRQELASACSQPFGAPNAVQYDRLCQTIHDSGTRVILDGHGGDEAIWYGYGRYGEIASEGAWVTLFRESLMARLRGGDNPLDIFDHYVRYARSFGMNPPRGYLRLRRLLQSPRKHEERSSFSWMQVLEPSFLREMQVEERYRQSEIMEPGHVHGERYQHYRVLSAIRQPIVFDELTSQVSHHGLEGRYPFWDRRVIEFCLSVPSREKYRNGWSRRLLRRAMRGHVPAAIRKRHDKTYFTESILKAVKGPDESRLHKIPDILKGVDEYVNLEWATECADNIKGDNVVPREVFSLFRAITFGHWYENEFQCSPTLDAQPASDSRAVLAAQSETT